MKLNFLICITLLFLISSFSFSQNKRLDSMLQLTKVATGTSLIKLYNEISWEYKSSDSDTALYFSKKALQLATKENTLKGIAASYNSIGNVFQSKSNPDSALYYHKKSLAIKKEIKDSVSIADSYNNIGILLDESGNYLEALQNYFKALKIYEEKSTSFDQIPAVLVNIGIVYKKQKEYSKVLEYYKKALEIYKENNFKVGITIITGNIGGVLLKLNKNNEAITYFNKAKKMYTDLGYKKYIPYMDVNIATALYNLKQYNQAVPKFKNVITSFIKDNNLYELSNAKINLAKTYIETNKFLKAKEQLENALKITKNNKFKEFEIEALKYLSEVNFKLKKFEEAYIYQKYFHQQKDSLFEKTKVKDINELLVKYESSVKEKEIAQQKETLLNQELKLKNKTLYTTLLTGTLLILAIIFIAVYKRNQLKRNQLKREIELKDALATIKTQNRLQEQRLRISRDLHDNIGSQLTFIISSLDNLKFISKDVNDKLKNKLTNISSFTSETIGQLRDTIWAMNKNEISIEDLHTRILSFVEKAKTAVNNTHFEVNYTIDKNTSVSSLVGMNIFRVIQEAINNAIKYAAAKTISINIKKQENNIVIVVKDDGIGFSITEVELGNGLSNMEKRMSEINGKVLINSKKELGTTITLSTKINTANDV